LKRIAIKVRGRNEPTRYYLAGRLKIIQKIGGFPSLIQKMWEEENEVQTTFKLGAVTADFVYYVDEEDGDDSANTVMLNRDMELVSDNYFASSDLTGLVKDNDGLLWISKAVKYWQRADFIKPELLTQPIKKMLQQVDIEKLTAKEKVIYYAYQHNGPVKYSKSEALMAVMSNDFDQAGFSDPLTSILTIIEQTE
jgi:hypothetical protein